MGRWSTCHILVADKADGLRHRSNPGQADARDLLCEIGVFGEEAIAGMDGIGIHIDGRAQDGCLVEVAVRASAPPTQTL